MKLHSVLLIPLSSMFIFGCGDSGIGSVSNGDDSDSIQSQQSAELYNVNTSSNDPVIEYDFKLSTGVWSSRTTFTSSKDSDNYETTRTIQGIYDTEQGTHDNCQFHLFKPYESDEVIGDVSSMISDLESILNDTFEREFTTTYEFSDGEYLEITASDALGEIIQSIRFERLSSELFYNSGSLKISGDIFNEPVDSDFVCSQLLSVTNYGPIGSDVRYMIGSSYGDTRLIFTISYEGDHLTPGEYDLTLHNDISISISTIESDDERYDIFLSTSAFNITEGKINILEASDTSLVGNLYFSHKIHGYFKAVFDVSFP